jgi:hypothetical protein
MRIRVTATVAPGLARDPMRLARIDLALGRERTAAWHPRGLQEGRIAWEVETLHEAFRLRIVLERMLHARLDSLGVNPEPEAMLRSVAIDIVRDDG